MDSESIDLRIILGFLNINFGVNHLLVEGGPTTIKNFVQQNLVDQFIWIRSPVVAFSESPVPLGIEKITSILEKNNLKKESVFKIKKDSCYIWSRPNLPAGSFLVNYKIMKKKIQ
eukprot:GHVL01012652.1.p1 GENE.GHVL01012652.1~~GHVL01012652.1.p1  ORF type:complete len:115 (+),score=30.39 GHVL01012652.1:526-870(+)